jgi:hypothetical protein
MMGSMNRKTLETFRDGILCGAEAVREQAGRISLRTPWTYRKPAGAALVSRPWLLGLVVFSSVLTALVAFLYLRKRKQVADHYKMGPREDLESGETPESWDDMEESLGKKPGSAGKYVNARQP